MVPGVVSQESCPKPTKLSSPEYSAERFRSLATGVLDCLASPAMNGTIPPLSPPPTHPTEPGPPPKRGCGPGSCAVGCVVLLAVLVVGVIVAFVAGKKFIEHSVDQYTATEPVPIERPAASPEKLAAAQAKLEAFEAGLAEDGTPVALEMTGEELNLLFLTHPSVEALAGRVAVSIADDKLRALFSAPLDALPIPPIGFLGDRLDGRFLNGDVDLSLGMVGSVPTLYAERLSLNGLEIPESFMSGLRGTNLLEEAMKDAETRKFFEGFESIRIEGDKLFLVPKGAAP